MKPPAPFSSLSILSTLALQVLASAQDMTAVGIQLISNPRFEDGHSGWVGREFEILDDPGHGGGRIAVLHGPIKRAARKLAMLGVRIEDPPVGRELELVVHIRAVDAKAARELMINGVAYAADGSVLGVRPMPVVASAEGWTAQRVKYQLPKKTALLAVWFARASPGDVQISDVSLTVGEASDKENFKAPRTKPGDSLSGPGVIRARASTAVRATVGGDAGIVTFPIPNRYAEQIPLAFEVRTDPPDALHGWRWRERDDGRNLLCEVTVKAPPNRAVQVGWEALVLIGPRVDRPLPLAEEPANPAHAEPWTHATACVQSDDPAVAAKAEELAAGTTDVAGFVRNVLDFTSTNRGSGAAITALDARLALDCGGSCTSRANLCAALLRAQGIAARTQAHLPTWSGPLYEHWLVEYWHPGAGWIWVESTKGEVRPAPWSLVVLNTANPEDEDHAFDERIRHSGVMPGVALWAVHDIRAPLTRGKPKELNVARAEGPIRGDEAAMRALFVAAEAAFSRLRGAAKLGRSPKLTNAAVATAVATGDASALRAMLDEHSDK